MEQGALIQTLALGKRSIFCQIWKKKNSVGITSVSQLWQFCFLLLFSPVSAAEAGGDRLWSHYLFSSALNFLAFAHLP